MIAKRSIHKLLPVVFILLPAGVKPLYAKAAEPATLTLMPAPQNMQLGSGRLVVNSSLVFAYQSFHDGRLERAVGRMLHRLEFETGSTMNLVPVSGPPQATLIVDVQGPGEAVQSINEDESYSLKVDTRQIRLHAATDVGAIRGLQTLLQLVELRDGQYVLPAVDIEDAPRFCWRALLLDVSRHFEPVPVILRTLDGMEAVKLNVFHWHLSDDQGFRVESKVFPKLQGMGSDGQFYTQEQIRRIIAYARDRGIRIVPEFDMPGHSTSWFPGYPDLASAPGPYDLMRHFGLPQTAMDPTRESTFRFLDAFVGEMAALFPDAYFEFGGDESRGEQWMPNRKIVDFMLEKNIQDPAALETYFANRMDKIIRKHGKIAIGWSQVFKSKFGHKDFGPWVQLFQQKYGRVDFGDPTSYYNIPKDVLIDSAGTHGSLQDFTAEGLRRGYQMIASERYYLDAMQSAEYYYLQDPTPAEWNISPALEKNVLGGQVCMWGELIAPYKVDAVIWPRTAAIAERFWSPSDVRDVNDMYRRLWVESLRLEQLGLTHISGPQKMRRNLAGTENPAALTGFASAIEPISLGAWFHLHGWRDFFPVTAAPLDKLIDAVVADPPARHLISIQIDELLTDPQHQTGRAELAERFEKWQRISPSLEPLLGGSPRMAETKPMAQQLGQLGKAGMEALDCLQGGQPQSPNWQQDALALLTSAEKPYGEVHFTFLPSLRRMVLACGQNGKP